VSEKILTKELWDYTIEIKKGVVLRKKKAYPLSREEREGFIFYNLRSGRVP